MLHKLSGFRNCGGHFPNHLLDPLHRTRRLFGQLADLLRHDREPTSLFAGSGAFNHSVQRQQIGLLGDRLDHGRDLSDRFRFIAEIVDLLFDIDGYFRVFADRLLQMLHAGHGCLVRFLGFLDAGLHLICPPGERNDLLRQSI
ncbi:hypothetical protein D3C74_314230 [compost metagenome]